MMLRIFAGATSLVALFSFAQPAFCQAWQDILAQAAAQAETGNSDSAQVLFEKAVQAAETYYTQSDSTVVISFRETGDRTNMYYKSFEDAEQLYRDFLDSAERWFGPNHVVVSDMLARLSEVYHTTNRFVEAEQLLLRALSIREETYGEKHVRVADALRLLGWVTQRQPKLQDSEFFYRRAVIMDQELSGSEQAKVVKGLQDLAVIVQCLKRAKEADSLLQLALSIQTRLSPTEDIAVGDALFLTGSNQLQVPDFDQSRQHLTRALAIYERLAPDDSRVAFALERLGWLSKAQGELGECLRFYQRAYAQRERTQGANYPLAAEDISAIAGAYEISGNYYQAIVHYEKYLDFVNGYYGSDHRFAGEALASLSFINGMLGKYYEAEQQARRALEIQEKTTPATDSPLLANILISMAHIREAQGDYGEAEQMLRGAVDAWKTYVGTEDSPYFATFLEYLAGNLVQQRKLAEADSLYNRALAAHRELGDAFRTAMCLSNIGGCYAAQERATEADSVLSLSLELLYSMPDTNALLVASTTYQLGLVKAQNADYALAESLMQQTRELLGTSLIKGHPKITETCRYLAQILAASGAYDKSAAVYYDFMQSNFDFIDGVFSYSSEGAKLKWARQHPTLDPYLLTVSMKSNHDRLLTTSAEMIMNTKGIVIDALSAVRATAYCSGDNTIADLLEEHNSTCAYIANNAIGQYSDETDMESLDRVYRLKDSLEAEISRRCSEFAVTEGQERMATLHDVAQTLDQAVLWEYVRYVPKDVGESINDSRDTVSARYAAFALGGDGRAVLKDLCDAATADSLVTLARDLMYKAQGQIYSAAAVTAEERLNDITGQLYDLIFAPLAEVSNDKTNVYVSPDGLLNLLPFEILPMPDGSYVVENYRISYLSSGRDLLKYKGEEPPEGEMIVMADPDFDGVGLAQAKSPFTVATVSSELYGPDMRGITDCLESGFSRLGHTRTEAQAVAKQLQATVHAPVIELYDNQAVEDALKNLSDPPRVLHLATHGFFCETAGDKATLTNNPLLRSGLVLTGANRTISGTRDDSTMTEDGILTALEVSGLNLVGTDLAVLSACESGVGEFVNGEGLFGLRRAFQHAGVETIVMSLWSVPDKETSQLMDGFYRRWLNGSSKCDALRESALEVLGQSRARRGCGHPLLWGGFILAGNPN